MCVHICAYVMSLWVYYLCFIYLKTFSWPDKTHCVLGLSSGLPFYDFCFYAHEVFLCSWSQIRDLGPSIDSHLWGGSSCGVAPRAVFMRVHVGLERHLHHSLGQSGMLRGLGDSWYEGRVRQCQGTWRRWHGTWKCHAHRSRRCEFSRSLCDP